MPDEGSETSHQFLTGRQVFFPIEVAIRPREVASAVCSGCQKPAPGYDHLPERRFEFIPFWDFLVFFLWLHRNIDVKEFLGSRAYEVMSCFRVRSA